MKTPPNPHPATAISRGPHNSALSAHILDEIRALPARYPQPRSAVMPALDLAQEELGHLTQDAMTEVAHALQLDPGYVEGVATFYTLFHLEPVGKHRFYVCTNLSCTLRGAEAIVEHLRGAIGVEEAGEVSKDGLFSYEEVECMGACEYAPMCRVDHRYHYDLTSEKIDAMLAERRGVPSPLRGAISKPNLLAPGAQGEGAERPQAMPVNAPLPGPGAKEQPARKPRAPRKKKVDG